MDIESLPDRPDRRFLIDTPVELAQVPANMTMGHEVLVEPHDPKLVHHSR